MKKAEYKKTIENLNDLVERLEDEKSILQFENNHLREKLLEITNENINFKNLIKGYKVNDEIIKHLSDYFNLTVKTKPILFNRL